MGEAYIIFQACLNHLYVYVEQKFDFVQLIN